MLLLSLAEHDFNDDRLLFFVNLHVLSFFGVKAFFAQQLGIANQKLTEFARFLVVVVRTDLIEPQSDFLEVLLLRLGLFHDLLGLLLQFLNHLVFFSAPLFAASRSLVAVSAIASVRIAVLLELVVIASFTVALRLSASIRLVLLKIVVA